MKFLIKKLNIYLWCIIFGICIVFTGCGRKLSEVTITVIGVDWSNSLYYLNEAQERQRILTLVKNIFEAKKLSYAENLLKKTWKGQLRGISLESIIVMPIASNEVSFREKIRCGTPEGLLDFAKDESAILPNKNSYTNRTDFLDFFNLAKNEAEHKLKDLEDKSIAIQRGIVKVKTDFILITDGIHDPKGLINIPNIIENINLKIIQNTYPNFSVESFADSISLPENTSKVFFVGVPPRLKFDLWQKVMNKKKIKCKFFEYEDIKSSVDIRNKLY